VKLCSQVYESIMERIGKSYDLSQDIWRFRAEEFLKHTESLNLGVDQIRVYVSHRVSLPYIALILKDVHLGENNRIGSSLINTGINTA